MSALRYLALTARIKHTCPAAQAHLRGRIGALVTFSLTDSWFRALCAVPALFAVGAAANYYMDLGWFGHWARLALAVTLLLTCILLALSRQTLRKDR
jgi:hypothetical protein